MTIDTTDDMIDVRDIIARVEELEDLQNQIEEKEELAKLLGWLGDLKGMGGDEQWRGDWYPVALIRDSYFKEYAQELADDIGATNKNLHWPHTCIDWDRAARELQSDYSSVELDDTTYWTR